MGEAGSSVPNVRREDKLKEPRTEILYFCCSDVQEHLSSSNLEAHSGTYSLNTAVLPLLCLKSGPQSLNPFVRFGYSSCEAILLSPVEKTGQGCHLSTYCWPV